MYWENVMTLIWCAILQVIDLNDDSPENALEWCRLLPTVTFRVLVCGGDGTIGWVLNAIESLKLQVMLHVIGISLRYCMQVYFPLCHIWFLTYCCFVVSSVFVGRHPFLWIEWKLQFQRYINLWTLILSILCINKISTMH